MPMMMGVAEEDEALEKDLHLAIGIHGEGEDVNNSKRSAQARQQSETTEYASYLTSLVNGVPLSDSQYVAPKPFGPEINGGSTFETAAKNVYQQFGFSKVDFHDEWVFHESSGDVHCLTNTFRDASQPWW
ncbi:hypothetical protein QQS21_010339 [Conoideocrella luteorostrata]|uniref:Protein-arginine deiminase C-terminal domain-containing protein n=1 Tax=Conoideocrella luteorostrata TaxID=1105319 RepID=A0AAJ0CHW2_9HYPO|nr:hypothetical protein QQS21_010339 [Conoideocrella luteorostrata]